MRNISNGVDIIDNYRIKKAIKNKKFVKRVFSLKEIKTSYKIKNKVNFFAKRFAAKEAFVKSLGSGFRNGINFNDISVTNNKFGKPRIELSNKLKKIINKKFKFKKYRILLSLSDEKKHSIAFVLINKY